MQRTAVEAAFVVGLTLVAQEMKSCGVFAVARPYRYMCLEQCDSRCANLSNVWRGVDVLPSTRLDAPSRRGFEASSAEARRKMTSPASTAPTVRFSSHFGQLQQHVMIPLTSFYLFRTSHSLIRPNGDPMAPNGAPAMYLHRMHQIVDKNQSGLAE